MALRFALGVLAGLIIVSNTFAQGLTKRHTDSLGDLLPDGAVARLGTRRLIHDSPNFNQFAFGRGGPLSSAVQNAVISPDGSKIASFGTRTLRLWDADTGRERSGPWNTASISSFAFSQDSNVLAASRTFVQQGIVVGEITLWDVVGAKKLRTFETDNPIECLALADQDKTLIGVGQGKVRWLDTATGKEQRSWLLPFPENQQQGKAGGKGTHQASYNFVSSADAKWLAVGVILSKKMDDKADNNRFVVTDMEVVAFDLAAQKLSWHAKTKPTPNSSLIEIMFSGGGKRVALIFGGDHVEVRDTITGKLVATPTFDTRTPNWYLGALAMSPDGKTVAFADNESRVMLWEPDVPGAALRRIVGRLGASPHYYTPSLAFSSDGKILLVPVDAELRRYDVATLQQIRTFDGHHGWVEYVAFSADGCPFLQASLRASAPGNAIASSAPGFRPPARIQPARGIFRRRSAARPGQRRRRPD